jgi:DNA invertase Pin-like site-specific DNA recombinase
MADTKDEFTTRLFAAMNSMLLGMLAAISRKDYDDRRRRAAQGIAKAKAQGKYRGRPENASRNAGIAAQLRGGASWSERQKSMGVSQVLLEPCGAAGTDRNDRGES